MSASWKEYVGYVDGMVLEGLDSFIRKSLSYLNDNMAFHVSRPDSLRA